MNGENVKIEKIKKSSKVALVISNICKILVIACSAACLLGGCVIFGFREKLNILFASGLETIVIPEKDLNHLEKVIGTALIESGHIADALGIYVFEMCVILVCLAVVFHFVGKTFKVITENDSPFCPEIIKNLKISFILITVLELTSSLLIGLLIGVAAWCVISIFEYGCELQKQSDETL